MYLLLPTTVLSDMFLWSVKTWDISVFQAVRNIPEPTKDTLERTTFVMGVGSNFDWYREFSVVGFPGRRTCLGNMVT